MKFYVFLIAFLTGTLAFAQTTIRGTVKDSDNLPLPGANVRVVGHSDATSTDLDGNFTLQTSQKPPFSLEITSIGFTTQNVSVSNPGQTVFVKLQAENTELDEIVVSASRTPERVLESPVTIERMNVAAVRNTTSPTFYDGLENLKEVHFNTSSLSFKSINTRGFSSVANTRFLQLVDGMDNSSPALNFVLGNLVGLSELDVASVELLPGASSALYGANAFNGILFMNSKSPFTNQGISTYFKYGKTMQDAAGTNDYYDFGLRMAHAFTPKFAAKANFNLIKATEWIANESRSMTAGGDSHAVNPNYDGLNIYGDEVTTFLPNVGQVSRTGYREQDVNPNEIESVKADVSLHFKPFEDDFEIILQEKVGIGSTIYQGANRYALKNFLMNQVRVEIKNRNFFLRGYVTHEDAGDSYDMRFAAWNTNRSWKSDQAWFTDYATAFLLSQANFGYLPAQSHDYARQFADYNVSPGLPLTPNGQSRFMPGTNQFKDALARVIENPDLTQGARFMDNSKIWHADANYNFKELIDFAEFQVGGSFRQYALNSQGTIFTDYDGVLRYNEYGAYAQMQKKFMDERLKFTGSLRYDKSELFKGFVSPRIAFVYSAGEKKSHNFRASFQTGFRNPTTQDLFIGLDLGPFALIGSAANNLSRYVEDMPVSENGRALLGLPTNVPYAVTLDGNDAYNNSYTLASVTAFSASQNPADLEKANIKLVKPERVRAYELGYRTVLENGWSIDLNGYYNIYNDFLNQSRVITPYYGRVNDGVATPEQVALGIMAIANGDRRVYQIYSNSKTEVHSYGFGMGLSKKFLGTYEIGANYNYTAFEYDAAEDPAFVPGFNTPKHRIKGQLGNPNVYKNLGFNLNVRYNSEYLWQSSFGDGMVPENTVFDAQISYNIPAWKTMLKVGGSNLFGKDYIQVVGAGRIGQMVYAQLTINP